MLYSQNLKELDIETYFAKIEKLVDDEINNPNVFLNKDLLLEQKAKSEGIDKVNICLDLYSYFIYRSTNSARCHNDEALNLAIKLNHHSGRLRALNNQAYILFVSGEFEKSLALINSTQNDKNLEGFPEIKADFEILKSYIHTERGEYDTAFEICINLLNIGERKENDYILMRSYSALSHIYLRNGDYEKALGYCLKGLNYIIKLKSVRYLFPKIDEIARMSLVLKGSKNALEVYEFYLKLENRISGPGDYIQSVAYMNIAGIYIEEKKYDQAGEFLSRAMDIIDSNGYLFRKPRAYELLAKLNLERRDTLNAIFNYEKGLMAAKEIKAFDVMKNTSGALAALYKSKGNTAGASKNLELHTTITDSLFSIEANQRVKLLESQLRISEISQQNEILELRNRGQEERYKLTFLVLILALMSAGIAGFSYLKVKKKNRLLFKRTKELAITQFHEQEVEKAGANQSTKSAPAECDNQKQNIVHEDVKQIILAKLKRFEADRFYLNPNSSLRKLSDDLQTNQKYLSQVINQEKKTNFNNYLNGLRINYLLQRLVEDIEFRNSKLSYIGATAGFNNLNTFNTAFKKRLGILPSYFIKELNEDEKKERKYNSN